MRQERLKQQRTYLALKIIARRNELGLNQEALAALAGVKIRALADIERGQTKDPRTDTLVRIANALKISLDYLLGRPAYPIRRAARPKAIVVREATTEVLERTA